MKLLPAVVAGVVSPDRIRRIECAGLWLTAMGWIEFASGSLYLIIPLRSAENPSLGGIQITQESVLRAGRTGRKPALDSKIDHRRRTNAAYSKDWRV